MSTIRNAIRDKNYSSAIDKNLTICETIASIGNAVRVKNNFYNNYSRGACRKKIPYLR